MAKKYRDRLKLVHVERAVSSLGDRGVNVTADNILVEVGVLFNNTVGGSKHTVLRLGKELGIFGGAIRITGKERLEQLVGDWVMARMSGYEQRIKGLELRNVDLSQEVEDLRKRKDEFVLALKVEKGRADDIACRSNRFETENISLRLQVKRLEKAVKKLSGDEVVVDSDDDPNGLLWEFEAELKRKVDEALEYFGKDMVNVEMDEFYVFEVEGNAKLLSLWDDGGIDNLVIHKMFVVFIANKHLDREHSDFGAWCKKRGV